MSLVHRFGTHADCAAHVEAHLRDWPFADATRRSLASAISGALVDDDGRSPPRRDGYRLVVGDYVVRESDLAVFDAIKAAVLAAAPVGFFTSQASASAIVGVVFAVFTLARNTYKKGVQLTQLQLRTLLCIRASGRVTLDELTANLNDGPTGIDSPWTTVEVEGELNTLSKIALRDGTVVSLVAVDGERKWGVVGV